MINAERAAMNAPLFANRLRTRRQLLEKVATSSTPLKFYETSNRPSIRGNSSK